MRIRVLPETRGRRRTDQDVVPSGWARVSYIRDAPDGRRFVNEAARRVGLSKRGT
jgi:hypothetical protein